MAKLAFFTGSLVGLLVGLFLGAVAIDDMFVNRIKAGAMVQDGVAYRIIPLEARASE